MVEEMERHDKHTENKFGMLKVKKMESQMKKEIKNKVTFMINEGEMFKEYVEKLNFERQKSTLLLEEIIQILDDERVELAKDRMLCEFLYLISSRCLFIVSPITDALRRRANIFKW